MPQVALEERRKRAKALRRLGNQNYLNNLQKQTFRRQNVLVETNNGIGKTENNFKMSIQRIHSGWNQKGKKRQIGQIASALAVSIWKISKKTLLNLENEGFDTDTWSDRMEILKEVSCFQIYIIKFAIFLTKLSEILSLTKKREQ